MAQALYNIYKQDLLDRATGVDFDTDTIRAIFVTTGYTFTATHQDFADLTTQQGDGGTGRANGEALASKTVTDGVADADNPVFTSVSITNGNAFILYKDSGVDATSILIGYFDSIGTFSASAQQVTISFDAAGIFFF